MRVNCGQDKTPGGTQRIMVVQRIQVYGVIRLIVGGPANRKRDLRLHALCRAPNIIKGITNIIQRVSQTK